MESGKNKMEEIIKNEEFTRMKLNDVMIEGEQGDEILEC